MEVEEPVVALDAFGKPVEFSAGKKGLRHVARAMPFSSRSLSLEPPSFVQRVWKEAKGKLRHIDGTAEQMRSKAQVFGPRIAGDGDAPAFVTVARAKSGASLSLDGFESRGLPRGAAAAALGGIDADNVDAEGDTQEALLNKSGRPIGATMLYVSQVGLVAFINYLLDLLVLAALWVLVPSDAPKFGVVDPTSVFPPPPPSRVPQD